MEGWPLASPHGVGRGIHAVIHGLSAFCERGQCCGIACIDADPFDAFNGGTDARAAGQHDTVAQLLVKVGGGGSPGWTSTQYDVFGSVGGSRLCHKDSSAIDHESGALEVSMTRCASDDKSADHNCDQQSFPAG